MNLRRIARILCVNHQSVANWVNAYARSLPDAPVPEAVETTKLDELFTFVGNKKHRLHHDHRGSCHSLHHGVGSGLGTQ